MKFSSDILCRALSAILLTACSADDTPQGGNPAAREGVISYTVAASSTRAVISGTTFPTSETFRVWAYAGETAVIPGAEVRCLSGDVWGTEDNYYWPEGGGSVDFYAVYPKDVAFDTATKTLSYTADTDRSKQKDVMYETVTRSEAGVASTGNAVPLTMHHALTQIAFKGKIKSDNKDWTADVTGVEICNVSGSGTFSLSAKTWSDLSAPKAYAIGMANETVSLGFYEADGETEAEAKNLTAADGSLLLIPQTLTAWDCENTTVSTTTGCYLAITCWIRNSAGNIRGTSEAPVTVYVPFDNSTTQWQSGKKYTYTLHFGAGYDEEGKTITVPITLTSEVTDWEEGTGGELPAEMTKTE